MIQKKPVESSSEMSKPTIQMYLRTLLLFLSWLTLGICGEIIGPTMGIVAHNMNVKFNGIATALASSSAANFITNILCGIFQNFVNNYQDLMLTISFFSCAIIMSTIPFVSLLLVMCIVFFIQGVAFTIANMGGTNLLLKMWDTRAAAPLNMIHLGYSLGAIVANLLVRPFLNNDNLHINTTVSSQFNFTLSTSISVPLNSDIRIPYLISAGLCFVMGVGHFIFLIQKQNYRQDKIKKRQVDYAPISTISSKTEIQSDEIKFSEYSPATCGHGYFIYGLSLSIVFTLYIFFLGGTDQIFAKFYFSYLKFDKFGISTDDASWGIILYWVSFSIGRLIGAIGSVFIPIGICLVVIWCGSLVLAVIWMIYVWILGLTATSLFVLGSLTGFIVAPVFPMSFGWINQKLNATPLLLAALFCGGGLGLMILQKIGGLVMDRDPNHFPTLLAACIMVTIIFYIISNVIVFFHKRSLKNKQDKVINDVPSTVDKLDEEEQQQMIN